MNHHTLHYCQIKKKNINEHLRELSWIRFPWVCSYYYSMNHHYPITYAILRFMTLFFFYFTKKKKKLWPFSEMLCRLCIHKIIRCIWKVRLFYSLKVFYAMNISQISFQNFQIFNGGQFDKYELNDMVMILELQFKNLLHFFSLLLVNHWIEWMNE